MGRRRKFKPLKSTKAWPILVLLAGVYWVREQFGIRDARSFSAGLNAQSESFLPYAPWLFGAALLFLVIRLSQRKSGKEHSPE